MTATPPFLWAVEMTTIDASGEVALVDSVKAAVRAAAGQVGLERGDATALAEYAVQRLRLDHWRRWPDGLRPPPLRVPSLDTPLRLPTSMPVIVAVDEADRCEISEWINRAPDRRTFVVTVAEPDLLLTRMQMCRLVTLENVLVGDVDTQGGR